MDSQDGGWSEWIARARRVVEETERAARRPKNWRGVDSIEALAVDLMRCAEILEEPAILKLASSERDSVGELGTLDRTLDRVIRLLGQDDPDLLARPDKRTSPLPRVPLAVRYLRAVAEKEAEQGDPDFVPRPLRGVRLPNNKPDPVDAALAGLRDLKRWVTRAREQMPSAGPTFLPSVGTGSLTAEQWVIAIELPKIYRFRFGLPLRFGYSESTSPAGPATGVRFICAAMKQLGRPKTFEAAKKMYVRGKALVKGRAQK